MKDTTKSMSDDDGSQPPTMTTMDLWMGFLSVHLLLAPTVLMIVSCLLGGYYYYPSFQWIIPGFFIPYYTYTHVWDPCHRRTGSRWDDFSRNFPPFRYGRRMMRLRVVGNPALLPPRGTNETATTNTEVPDRTTTTTTTPANKQYILGVFPHGLNADYRILVDGLLPDVLPSGVEVRTLAATVLFGIPLVRELALWTGCVDASKSVAERNLREGLSLLILPGGQQEQLRTSRGRESVYVRRRKGFVRLAMERGIPLVPVYVFGANDLYRTSHFALSTRLFILKYLGISITLGTGFCGSWYCPLPIATTMVLGEPIPVAKVDHPTAEQVDRVHARFVDCLQTLFDEHKGSFGYGDRTLEIM